MLRLSFYEGYRVSIHFWPYIQLSANNKRESGDPPCRIPSELLINHCKKVNTSGSKEDCVPQRNGHFWGLACFLLIKRVIPRT